MAIASPATPLILKASRTFQNILESSGFFVVFILGVTPRKTRDECVLRNRTSQDPAARIQYAIRTVLEREKLKICAGPRLSDSLALLLALDFKFINDYK